MVFFKRKEKVPTEPQRLDWRLLERGAIALYYKSSVLSADLGWFRQAKYVVHEMNGTTWDSPAAFHTDVQRALGFPDYYTKNLASWIDCLAELHVPDESGTVLVFRRFDVFAKAQQHLAQTILDSIECTSRRFPADGPAPARARSVRRPPYSLRAGRCGSGDMESARVGGFRADRRARLGRST
jgi:RNAse (barnase) inhibitor barstar